MVVGYIGSNSPKEPRSTCLLPLEGTRFELFEREGYLIHSKDDGELETVIPSPYSYGLVASSLEEIQLSSLERGRLRLSRGLELTPVPVYST